MSNYCDMSIIEHRTVSELPEGLILVNIDYDVDALNEHFSLDPTEYACFIVGIADGAYTEVWGIVQSIPCNNTMAYKLV